MQSMTRSVSLNLSSLNQRRHQNLQNSDQIEAFDGETAALKQFCFHVRSYGTCGDFTPYVPSPTSQNHKFKKCLTHIVAEHETLAGIALKYDISVEDIRRINSFLWTSNSVWVGQIIKVPVIDRKIGIENSENQNQKQKSSKLSDQQGENLTENSQKPVSKKDKRKLSPSSKTTKLGPSPTEFWTKVDSSIEESKKVTSQLKKNSPSNSQEQNDQLDSKLDLKC